MKRTVALLLVLVMALSLFAGCGSDSKSSDTSASASASTSTSSSASASEKPQEPVTIKWMHHFAEEARIAWAQKVADKTHEIYPYITVEVEVQPYDKYVTTLKAKIQSDDAPELYNLQSRALLQEFVTAGYCADLSAADFIPNIMTAGTDAGKIGDKIYSIVQDMGGAVVFYNKKIFSEQGLKVPTIYSEWTATLETLKKSGVAPIAAGYQEVWPLLVDTYADFVPALFKENANWAADKMSGVSKFEGDTKFADIIGKIYNRTRYTQADAFGTDWNKACELVAAGKAATVIGGFFALDAIQSKNPDIDLGAFALPVSENVKDSIAPLGNSGGFIVYEGAKKDAAMKLLGVILSKEMAGEYQVVAKTISTVKGIEGEMAPALKDILEIEKDGRVLSTSSLAYTFTGEYQKAYVTNLSKFLMTDKMDVAGFAKTLDAEFKKVTK